MKEAQTQTANYAYIFNTLGRLSPLSHVALHGCAKTEKWTVVKKLWKREKKKTLQRRRKIHQRRVRSREAKFRAQVLTRAADSGSIMYVYI